MPDSKKSAHKSAGVDDAKIISAIGYLGILCLVPLLLKKDDALAQHHGKQGLVILIAWVLLGAVGWIPLLGWMIAVIGSAILLILMIIGIIKALNGEMWVMPVLGKYAEQIKL